MKNVIKTAFAVVSLTVLSMACKKGDAGSNQDESGLAQIAALENRLDSLNSLPATVIQGSLANPTLLTNAEANEYYTYFKAGIEAIKLIRSLASVVNIWFGGHKWLVISYSDGYCIFDNVRSYRTIEDAIRTSMGYGGTCDYRTYPIDKTPEVCLRNKTDAQALIKKHGKILCIKFIDHPTKNCGK